TGHFRQQRIDAERDRTGNDRDDSDRASTLDRRDERRDEPQHGQFGEKMGLYEAGQCRPFRRQRRQARLARERHQQRRAIYGEQNPQDRAEVAQIGQCGFTGRLSYNSLHSGRDICKHHAGAGQPGMASAAYRVGQNWQLAPDRPKPMSVPHPSSDPDNHPAPIVATPVPSGGTWSGRFAEPMSERMQRFNASVDFDRRLAEADIAGSLAHAKMLATRGILSAEDLAAIERGLHAIEREIATGTFVWQRALEDVHFNIERRLTAL